MSAFWQGVIAGYGIAIPVGAIAVLIVDLALRRGFRSGFAAGAGAATADLIYAALAVAVGTVLAAALRPFALPLAAVSGGFLIGLGMRGVWRARHRLGMEDPTLPDGRPLWLVYIQFLGLTLLNPLTIVYFAALVLGGSLGDKGSVAHGLLFVLGAGLASLSWQSLLAAGGSQLGQRLPPHSRLITSLIGNLVVIALGVRILVQAFWLSGL
ncbi:MAG: LysE family transporter [Anaerolineales bacterium]|nr:LysE family transporter [Anaerolineales bacterium]